MNIEKYIFHILLTLVALHNLRNICFILWKIEQSVDVSPLIGVRVHGP